MTDWIAFCKAVNLLPCPFCGSATAVRLIHPDFCKCEDSQEGWIVSCDFREGGCGASSGWSHDDQPERAEQKWNRRADQPSEHREPK